MKKMKRLFLIILSAIMVTASLVGCAGDGASSDGSTPPKDKITNPVLTWNAFDSYADLWMFETGRTFGDLSLNKDSQYIVDGEGSGKATICAQEDVYLAGDTTYLPTLKTPTKKIPDYGVYTDDNSDFSMVSLVSFDVYNPNDFDTTAAIKLFYNASTVSIPEYQVVKAKSWTTIKCPVQREFIPETVIDNRTGALGKKVEFIQLLFIRYDFEYTLYLDNLCFYKELTEAEDASTTLKTDEVCSFDEYWQYKKFSIKSEYSKMDPTVEWIRDPNFDNRGGMLKVVTTDRSKDTSGSGYPTILLPSDCFTERFNSTFAKLYDENDLFCIDVRIEDIVKIDRFYIELYYGGVYFTSKTLVCSDTEKVVDELLYYATADSDGWYTFKVPVSSLLKHIKEVDKVIDGEKKAVNELQRETTLEEGFATLTKLNFCYRSAPGYPSETFYLDSFYMEKVD